MFEDSPEGAPGTPVHPLEPPTVNETSFDGAPMPELYFARMRTKKVPGGTLVTVNEVAMLPVSIDAMFDAPGDDPASMTYDVAGSGPAAATHDSTTVPPLTDAERFADAFGSAAEVYRPRATGTMGDELQVGAAAVKIPAPLPTRHPQSIVAANAWPAGDATALSVVSEIDGAVGVVRLQPAPAMASATTTWAQMCVLRISTYGFIMSSGRFGISSP
jgi:hypothetical protein